VSPSTANLRGIALMVAATAAFIINDTILKFIMVDIPPFETLFVRGVFTVCWGTLALTLMGGLGQWRSVFDPAVAARNGFELVAVLGYILALRYAPIADVTALSQLAPMLLTLGAVWFFGAKIGRAELALICLAFFGALMVAQPGGSGFSAFALLGLWNALASAARDLAGRRAATSVSGMAVALGAGLFVMIGAGLTMLVVEHFVMPDGRILLMFAASALFLTGGHMMIFLAYRAGSVAAVAPFFYSGTVWALIAGWIAFQQLPNALALAGIGIILVSGVAVVAIDARRNWMTA
jgi:drug/metabolite transporter (DMT)-like permease